MRVKYVGFPRGKLRECTLNGNYDRRSFHAAQGLALSSSGQSNFGSVLQIRRFTATGLPPRKGAVTIF